MWLSVSASLKIMQTSVTHLRSRVSSEVVPWFRYMSRIMATGHTELYTLCASKALPRGNTSLDFVLEQNVFACLTQHVFGSCVHILVSKKHVVDGTSKSLRVGLALFQCRGTCDPLPARSIDRPRLGALRLHRKHNTHPHVHAVHTLVYTCFRVVPCTRCLETAGDPFHIVGQRKVELLKRTCSCCRSQTGFWPSGMLFLFPEVVSNKELHRLCSI